MRLQFLLLPKTWLVLALLLLATVRPFGAEALPDVVRTNNAALLRTLLAGGANLEAQDAQGNTALHWAALNGDDALVRELLKRGAHVNATNHHGATPLIYAVGNLDSVKALINRGAAVNRASTFGTSPLIAAARYPQSSAIVRFLLQHGADPQVKDKVDGNALTAAAAAGDAKTAKLLLEAGLKPTQVYRPAQQGHLEIVAAELKAGADLQAHDGFVGHALNYALYGQQPEVAKFLIEHGADLTLRSPEGEHQTPPILWAAYNESGDASVAQLMIEKGVDVNMLSARGESALDWARARNNLALEKVLLDAGAREGSAQRKSKPIPNRELPTDRQALDPFIRQSASRAIALLQHSSDVFLQSGVVKNQQCVSCHHQTLPAVAFAWAREHRLPVDDISIARQVQEQIRFWNKDEKVAKTYEMIRPQPDASVLIGYGLLGLSALGYPGDALTEAMVWYLTAAQRPDGSWGAADYRPPMEDGPIQGTAFALRALQLYPLAARPRELEKRIERARGYLMKAKPVTFNQRVFQLLGLGWAGARQERLQPYVQAILERQQADGGWAQIAELPSDAWATGQALVALNTAGGLAASDAAFQRGVRFLLRTQFEDGSWYVRSRSWPFQPHFESAFPHGKDQWISASATAWAAMALVLTQPKGKQPAPVVDWMAMKVPHAAESSPLNPEPPAQPARGKSEVDFVRDIEPLLQRSCAACHAGDRKRGQFSILTREAILKGGQSREPVLVPGNSEASRLIRMVTGQVEDLEMPPLAKRNQYPALTPEEVALFKTWIDQGLPWKPASSTSEPGDKSVN